MEKYVKFLRGTPDAYANLAQKDSDTLYFIYEEDESTGVLYLGTKLIAGSVPGEGDSGIKFLSDLKDVLLSEYISEDSFLVYDTTSGAWINKTLDELIFMGPTDESSGLPGLVPAPQIGQFDLFLKSDGTWAKPPTISESSHIILTLENTDKISHFDLITQATVGISNNAGDIIIIKDLIAIDKWSYTAYVFENSKWCAMDGNYSAENVYFSKDLVVTTQIGNIELNNGKAIISAEGKNLKEVFETLFAKEENPSIKEPNIEIVLNNDQQYEIGSIVRPSYIATFDNGEYSYGPDTGVEIISWEVTDSNGNTLHSDKGTFNSITIIDNMNYSITATARYTNGSVPVTNLGNEYLEGQIKSGSISYSINNALIGYRNSFYGTLENKDELFSANIRTLTMTDKELVNGASITVPIPIGAFRTVFAYPSTLNDLESVIDVNGLGAEIISSFSKSLINVSGQNDYDAIEYKVYYIDYAKANNSVNSYIFKIKED